MDAISQLWTTLSDYETFDYVTLSQQSNVPMIRYTTTLRSSIVILLAALSGAASAERITVNPVANAVPECPAFDIVHQNILTLYGAKDSRSNAGAAAVTADPVAVEIIFDASGSMAGVIGGTAKIELARSALAVALGKLDATDALVGVRAYGFDTSVEKTPAASCPNTQLVSAFASRAARRHAAAANTLQPYGYTPIANSLVAAGRDLQALTARERTVILITDGEETCEGDPVGAARQLQAVGIDISTYVVGFDLDDAQRAEMLATAKAGGGSYFDAADGAALQNAIDRAVNITVEKSERKVDKCINHVAGGTAAAAAVPVTPGLYTLGEFLPKGDERFYRIELQPGETAVFRGLMQSQRWLLDDSGKPYETKYALGAMTIRTYDANGNAIGGRAARMRDVPGTTVVREIAAPEGGEIIFSIGDAYDAVAPDALFAVDIVGAKRQ